MRVSPILLSVLLAVGNLTATAHHAVLRFNLEEMVATADRVFVGRCLGAEESTEFIAGGNLAVTRYTFEIERVIKGRLPARLTFTQLGHRSKPASTKGGQITMHGRAVTPDTIHGMGEYNVGDRLVLFLIPNYLGGKITYPVGADQGAFFVSRMPSGQDLVRNNVNNLGLFTTPYNGWRMKENAAKMIFPDRDQPVVNFQDEGMSIRSEGLVRKRGALPLDAFVGLVEQIVTAHGGEKGVITR
jgi:hypothetical protein